LDRDAQSALAFESGVSFWRPILDEGEAKGVAYAPVVRRTSRMRESALPQEAWKTNDVSFKQKWSFRIFIS
jgi:hypothetical protein